MADVTGSVNYLTVTLTHELATGDSNDVGNRPDALPADGSVVIRPVGLRTGKPYVVAGEPPELYSVSPIVCKAVGGILYGPADGKAPATGETPAQPITIVDPLSVALDYVGWHWQADFTPATGAGWEQFSIPFDRATEDDGITVNLARAAMLDHNTTATTLPPIWPVDGDGTNPPAQPLNSRPGELVLDTSTNKLYLITNGA